MSGRNLDFLTRDLRGCTLTAMEAVRLAERWWDGTGRHLTSKTSNRDRRISFKPSANGAPAIRVRDKGDVVIPSRILQGCKWEDLDRRERLAVTKAWLGEYRKHYARGKVATGPH